MNDDTSRENKLKDYRFFFFENIFSILIPSIFLSTGSYRWFSNSIFNTIIFILLLILSSSLFFYCYIKTKKVVINKLNIYTIFTLVINVVLILIGLTIMSNENSFLSITYCFYVSLCGIKTYCLLIEISNRKIERKPSLNFLFANFALFLIGGLFFPFTITFLFSTTQYSEKYSEYEFNKIEVCDKKETVIQKLGKPLSVFKRDSCFYFWYSGTPNSSHYFQRTIGIKNGKVFEIDKYFYWD